MAETQITRCPHCQTTFRIRLEQLATAKGAVRCGSCLQVFKAADHFVSDKTNTLAKAAPVKTAPVKPIASKPAPSKPAPVKATPVKTAPKKVISFDDIPDQINDDPLEDFGIRQPERDAEETFNSGLKLDDSVFSMQESAKPSRYSLHSQDKDLDFTDDFDSDNFGSRANSSNTDESWASGLIDDETDDSYSKTTGDDDESWADALLDTDDDLLAEIDMSASTPPAQKEKDDFLPSLEDDSADEQYHLGGNNDYSDDIVEIELTLASSVNDLLDEPLNLDTQRRKAPSQPKRSGFLWLWSSGALLMILALVAQVGYFKFDSGARHPDYRASYALACQIIGCKLPAIQDTTKMNTQHFMVRLHPEVKQALYIDTLLINNAPYRQPFPDLKLVFTGLENQVIASRRFQPSEYLAGELAGVTEMPLNVPIHIALEIVNPGAEAVSYRIELASNQ